MKILERMRTQKLLSATVMTLTLSAGIVVGSFISTYGVKAADNQNQKAPGATPLVIPNPVELSNSFSHIAKEVEPSVVNISTTYNPRPSSQTRNFNRRNRQANPDEDQGDNGANGNGMDEFFYRFFGGSPFGGQGGQGQGGPDFPQMDRRSSALGSGVVVDRAGYILTNNHVVDKADRITVRFMNDPTEYEAKVVGVDVPTDLAVIRVMGKHDLVPAKIGNSDAAQVGDWCVAIGSPFGFQETVTAGIISAKERDIPGDSSQFQHFLQTDAAINPGNSGGPLLDIRGEVIGINTAIASRSGGYQGIGFAMPINTAAAVYNSIIKTGKMTRGSIGIQFTPSDTTQAAALLKANGATHGVFVQRVEPGGPSDKAGLKGGDIIVSLNGKPVDNGNALVETVTNTPIGSSLNVGVMRNGKTENYTVTVGDLSQIFPDQFGNGSEKEQGEQAQTAATFGMEIRNLTPQQRETLGIKEQGGIQVNSVEPDSFAEDIGLHQGDIILSLNQHPINSTDDLQRLKSTLKPGDAVALHILTRQGRSGPWTSSYVAGTMPANH
jgi:serine protease Do